MSAAMLENALFDLEALLKVLPRLVDASSLVVDPAHVKHSLRQSTLREWT
jgi:hypothetical protein